MHHPEQGLPHGDGSFGDMSIALLWFRVVDQLVGRALEELAVHAGRVFQEGLVGLQDGLDRGDTVIQR